jgi:lipoprotein NlpD
VAAPGYHIVKKGDTLIGIALDTGNDWRELAAWNNLDNPNRILVGQQLRVVPLTGETAAVEIKPVNPAANTLPAAVDLKPQVDASGKKTADAATGAGKDRMDKDKGEPPPVVYAWSWPASGTVIEGFSDARNKGIDISLKAGDPVNAALDGQVVYAGNALRGYGNLIIIKHNPTFLSAYAHNRKLLVKEGDTVKRSQQIAEAGSTDAERVKLHFEIRKGGKPVDPAKYLPTR